MTAARVALFFLGVYLSMRAVAALYRVIDLWYTIRTAYPRVARGIVGWCGAIALVSFLTAPRHRAAFTWGVAAFPVLYLGLYALRDLALRRPARPPGP